MYSFLPLLTFIVFPLVSLGGGGVEHSYYMIVYKTGELKIGQVKNYRISEYKYNEDCRTQKSRNSQTYL